ncbi:MAG: hypothetical protein M1115_00530 [Actinobacteria bacterium]|nr:hypothetical protein [Actinomycetota bacterium]
MIKGSSSPGSLQGLQGHPTDSKVRFAHESEARFAALLDFYEVAWEYEPVEFVLESAGNGRPTRAFKPDFYLPQFDLFIELTTARQRLVTRKNAKVRRLRELHPEIKIKILYKRDYRHLLLRFKMSEA